MVADNREAKGIDAALFRLENLAALEGCTVWYDNLRSEITAELHYTSHRLSMPFTSRRVVSLLWDYEQWASLIYAMKREA